MGHQLKAMGIKIEGEVGTLSRFLGVALANSTQPDLVRDAHVAYIDAGAEVITTNSYAVIPGCLKLCEDVPEHALDAKVRELVGAAGRAARAAVAARPGKNVRVAGCLPPLAESYRADKVGAFEANRAQYALIAESVAPYADLFLCETMSTAAEAAAAAAAARAVDGDRPVWVSYTLRDAPPTGVGGRMPALGAAPALRSGESIDEALAALDAAGVLGGVEGFLVNCCSPEATSAAIPVLKALAPPGAHVGAYANGFVTADSGTGAYRDLSPDEYLAFAADWVASGASVVGGCCGIFPDHIARLAAAFDADAARRVG